MNNSTMPLDKEAGRDSTSGPAGATAVGSNTSDAAGGAVVGAVAEDLDQRRHEPRTVTRKSTPQRFTLLTVVCLDA